MVVVDSGLATASLERMWHFRKILDFTFGFRVPDAVQRVTLLRRAGIHRGCVWTPDQQRTAPQVQRAAQHPGNDNDCPLAPSGFLSHVARWNVTPPSRNESSVTALPLCLAASRTLAISPTLNVRPLMISLAPLTKRKLPLASLSSGSPL